jgi:pimeloyl-ACP methyl ester carboxylesterase
MKHTLLRAASALALAAAMIPAFAAPALDVLGKDYTFPNRIDGLPAKLSDFKGLQINTFQTSDGVKLSYWEAGQGETIVFVPGWSANGAEYVNVMYLLSKKYHVVVLDPRNQGLSQRVDFGNRIARYGADLKDLVDHLGVKSFDLCGWSMGASVVWSYVDLYGTKNVHKLVFIDEPISIYAHADWSEQQRQDAGAITSSAERMVDAFVKGAPTNKLVVNSEAFQHYLETDSPSFVNSESFAREFIKNDPKQLSLVLFDHAVADWRDVVLHKLDVPTAIFTGEYSDSLTGQRWLHSVVPGSTLFVYPKAEHGDHFLAFKNPVKFTTDLDSFLRR